MTSPNLIVPTFLILVACSGCVRGAEANEALQGTLAARQARLEQVLTGPDTVSPETPVLRWILPDRLAELSGLTLTTDQRLFTHGDEFGKVYEIDYRRGVIVKEFSLGPPLVMDDFEAIAAVGDTLFMLTDRGVLYRFAEGADGDGVPYSMIDTGLGATCQFEGMAFDSSASRLVLACKNVEDGGRNDTTMFFLWPLDRDSASVGQPLESIRVSSAAIIGTLGWPKVEPSDITVDPRSGNYVVVASGQKGIFEITPTGEVVYSRQLPTAHAQPEGLAITRDNLLLISDEANTGPAVLTAYRRK